jgi:hypothetical protein
MFPYPNHVVRECARISPLATLPISFVRAMSLSVSDVEIAETLGDNQLGFNLQERTTCVSN